MLRQMVELVTASCGPQTFASLNLDINIQFKHVLESHRQQSTQPVAQLENKFTKIPVFQISSKSKEHSGVFELRVITDKRTN